MSKADNLAKFQTTITDGTTSVATSFVTNGSAKAFLNFNGTGTVAIRASFNVSGIVDNTTGDYTTNFTNNMSSADYTVTAANGGDTGADNVRIPKNTGSLAASGFSCNTVITGASINDATYVFQAVHGDLA